MREALVALNRLVADGMIRDYAIGGAIGASFYLPALQTEDVDAFIFLPPTSGGTLSLAAIYDALRAQGGQIEGAHVRFGPWPLQILPDANDLIAEAIQEATEVEFDGVKTRVFRPEYLCAVALQTGRAKDYLRVTMFLEQSAVMRETLAVLSSRYQLEAKLLRAEEQAKV